MRRTRLTDRRQAALWPDWRHFAFITDLDGEPGRLMVPPHYTMVEFAIGDLKEGAGM